MTTLQDIQSAIETLAPRERIQLERWFYTRIFPKDDIAGHVEGEIGVAESAPRYTTASASGLLSYEEYLKLEEHSDVRHEFVAGVLFAMSGASRNHNRISGNLFNAFSRHLGRGPCEAFIASFNVRIEHQNAGYYPDVMVTCEREKRNLYTMEPKLVVEVLSPSTRQTDEREKMQSYRSLESLQEYVLIEQDHPELIVYRRAAPWERLEICGLDAMVEFKSIGVSIPMAEVFEGVTMS